MPKRGKAGISVATILVFLATLLLIISTALAVGTFNLRLAVAHDAREGAGNAAEAAIAEAIGKLAESNFAFGQAQTDAVSVTLADGQPGHGVVSFDPDDPGHSVSNIANSSSVPDGTGGMVPAHTVRLVGRGKAGEVERWVECLVHRPSFPDPLVASGSIVANQLEVGAVRQRDAYTGGSIETIAPEDERSGSMFANSSGNAVHLEAGCIVSGNVESPGAVRIDPGNQVLGVVRTPGAPRPVPRIDIETRILNLAPSSLELTDAVVPTDLVLEPHWFSKRDGALNVSGDLVLDGSVLTVTGPLTVGGCLRGQGAVLVDGPVVLQGGSDLSSPDQLALAATGDIQVNAGDRASNFFKGLVYTQGDLRADGITVVGVLIADGTAADKGDILLTNSRVVHVPVDDGVKIGKPWIHFDAFLSSAIQIMVSVREEDGVKRFDLSSHYVSSGAIVSNRIDDLSQWRLEPGYGSATLLDLSEVDAYNILRRVNIGGLWPWHNQSIKNQHFAFGNHLDEILEGPPSAGVFDLNRLLADHAATLRVLSWKPLPPP